MTSMMTASVMRGWSIITAIATATAPFAANQPDARQRDCSSMCQRNCPIDTPPPSGAALCGDRPAVWGGGGPTRLAGRRGTFTQPLRQPSGGKTNVSTDDWCESVSESDQAGGE